MIEKTDKSTTLNYDVFVVKSSGLTRDLPAGTESLQWITNTTTLILANKMLFLLIHF